MSNSGIAQESGLILGLYTFSDNMWSSYAINSLSGFLNGLIAEATEGHSMAEYNSYNFQYLKMTDNDETVDYIKGKAYGFRLYDLFNNIECGLKAGWQGPESPIGAYLYCAYGLNQYKLRFIGDKEHNLHILHSVRAGMRVRVSPFRSLDEVRPIFDVGGTYIYNFKYRGLYDDDKDQVNNGMRTEYAAGVSINDVFEIMLCFDMSHYDIFNKNYTPDGGFWYPYANFKNKEYNFSLRFNYKLIDY